MKLKKLLSFLIGAAMLLPQTMMAIIPFAGADGDNLMDNYVIEEIFDKREVKKFSTVDGATGSNLYGFGFASRNDMQIDASGVSNENLALSARIYIENIDVPSDVSVLQAPFGQFELATIIGDSRGYMTWPTSTLKRADGGAITAGEWNDILLPFTSATRNDAAFDKSAIHFFRLELARIAQDPGTVLVRLMNVRIVDTSRPEDVVIPPVWDTTYNVADIPFTMDVTITGNGANTTTTSVSKAFTEAPVDASSHNPKMLRLQMDIEAENLTNPDDVSVLSRIKGQIELTSSGKADTNEWAWGVQSLNWKSGTNTYTVLLSSVSVTGGDLDLSNINFMRIYMNGWPEGFTDRLSIKVSNVKLIDATNEISLPSVFNDGMMFQQNKDMNIWGYYDEGESVEVKLYKNDTLLDTQTGTAGSDGKWQVSFEPQEGGYDEYSFDVYTGGKLVQKVEDILIGELWVAGGQSNMALSVNDSMDGAALIAAADNPNLRFLMMPTYPLGQTGEQPIDPAPDIPGAYWGYGDNSGNVSAMSAVAYTFAKNLQAELDVPVGIVNTQIGGTVIEAWLSREAIGGNAALKAELIKRGLYYDESWWVSAAGTMATLYNQKVGPLEGMNIAGTIWYQGESNSNRAEIYDIEIDLLKESWGEIFGFADDDMPFIFTQLAPWRYDNGATNKQHLGYIAESMENGWRMNSDNNTAMLTIYDLPLDHMRGGVSSDPIHPRVKTPVGERFYRSALNMVYGGENECTAPVYQSMSINTTEKAVYLTFDRVGSGLEIVNDAPTLHGFTIAGNDGVYINAKAQIVNANTVKVWSEGVSNPKNVIYAFDNFNQGANLANSAKIPASPFRTLKVSDTTYNPSPDITYFTAADWMTADGDVWVYDTAFTEEKTAGIRPSWVVSPISGDAGSVYSYDSDIKHEGISSVKLEYTGNGGTAGIGPVLSYGSLEPKLQKYNYISVMVLNPDDRNKKFSLLLKSGGNTYRVKSAFDDSYTVTLGQSNRFISVTFDLNALLDDSGTVTDADAVLSGVTGMQFTAADENAGVLYLDGVSIGMDLPDSSGGNAYKLGDVNNDGSINIFDIMTIRDHIFGKNTLTDNAALAADINKDTDINIFDIMAIRDHIFGKNLIV